jgi:tRNA nucleotidyltransferase (CCA-adding enzyme)
MEIYLVGGAVRDQLLNLPVGERDWVVVGASGKELEADGYKQVGKSFPVYLHPDTGEEYALARTEKKSGVGYHGFDVYAGEDVTLEQDLERRDLTINAIAEDENGALVDPFNGRQDIEKRILRHVSPAFSDDPLRVLRVARFAARFGHLGFSVASETEQLLKDMAADGELAELVPERVWKETEKALRSPAPQVYFELLHAWDALKFVYPEVDALFGVPQPEEWHPEIDTGVHILLTLRAAAKLSDELDVRFAALVHDLGKATSPKAELPRHAGHEKRSIKLIDKLCDRVGVPNRCRELGKLVAEFHTHVHRADNLRADTMLKVLNRCDAFRRPDRFESFLLACEADARGRAGLEDRDYPQADVFRQAFSAARNFHTTNLINEGFAGPALGEAIDRGRIEAIRAALNKA